MSSQSSSAALYRSLRNSVRTDGTFVPPPLFRYLSRKWADAMVERGSILLHPPRWFREQEGDSARGDPNEGRLPIEFDDVEGPTSWRNTPEMDEIRDTIIGPGGSAAVRNSGANVLIESNVWSHTIELRGALLYSMTVDGSGRLHAEFKTDTVVEIHDPRAFGRAVAAAVQSRYKRRVHFQLAACTYVTLPLGPSPETKRLDPALVKDRRKFRRQSEVRLLVHGLGPEIEEDDDCPLVVPQLAKLCHIRPA